MDSNFYATVSVCFGTFIPWIVLTITFGFWGFVGGAIWVFMIYSISDLIKKGDEKKKGQENGSKKPKA